MLPPARMTLQSGDGLATPTKSQDLFKRDTPDKLKEPLMSVLLRPLVQVAEEKQAAGAVQADDFAAGTAQAAGAVQASDVAEVKQAAVAVQDGTNWIM